jgi:hypothetical protein
VRLVLHSLFAALAVLHEQGISEATQQEVESAERSSASSISHGSAAELLRVLVLEGLIWHTLDSIAVLATKTKRVVREVLLPPAILQLRPPGKPSAGTEGSSSASSGTNVSPDLYPQLRRAQRLGYSLATFLQDAFDVAESRQVITAVHLMDAARCPARRLLQSLA